ncbi:MAG TPA: B12-binding domain-containing radical SAM protein [Desulfobacterales bacterium]
MTDVLLIQPPIRDFYLTAKRTLPYGLASMAAVLVKDGFRVEILDALCASRSRALSWPAEMNPLQRYYGRPDQSPFALFHRYRHYGYSLNEIGRRARDSGAFLVGISSLFSAYAAEALAVADTVRSFHPAAKIVMGGHHPTAMPELVMASAAVDYVLRGDGEASIVHLARSLRDGQGLDHVPGLVRRKGPAGLEVRPPARLSDVNALPLPEIELFAAPRYRRYGRACTVVVTARGCPLACSYCCMRRSAYPGCRRSVDSVIAEIDQAVHRHGVGFIDFEDENLSLDRNWFLQLLQAIRTRFSDHDLELRAMNGLYPASLDAQLVAAMAAAGFRSLNLSLGSSDPEQLKRFRRPDLRRAFDQALMLAEKHHLQAVGYVIAAAPDQQAQSSVRDLLYLAERRVLAGLSIFYPAPGSPDYERCRRLGILPQSLSRLRASSLPIEHITSRTEAVTLLRLSRILNYLKALLDRGVGIPTPAAPPELPMLDPADRDAAGIELLRWFLYDGAVRGLAPNGEVYLHTTDPHLTRAFLEGLKEIQIRGCL